VRMDNENEPRQTSWLIFRDAPHGLPTYWVPPRVLPSPTPPSSNDEPPTSLKRGGVSMARIRGQLLGALMAGPHPS